MYMRKDDKPSQYCGVRRKRDMKWQDDFAEGFKTGEDNNTSLGMVVLFIFALCIILAALIIIIGGGMV